MGQELIEALATLEACLPALPTCDGGETVENQARGTLRFIIEPALKSEQRPAIAVDPRLCPNCDHPSSASRTPYCCDHCKESAAFVRQFRSALSDGMALDPDRQLALGQKFWHLAGGGYPFRLTLAPPSALKQVQKRTSGLCEICGNPASTYDHLGSG